ncbi:MAG: VOC family protein [Pseudobdellovibrionaceae bacterium]
MKLIMPALLWMTLYSQSTFAKEATMPQVTGIGGVFFKSKGDAKALTAWYQKNLGVKIEVWGGAAFKWSEDPAKENGATAWQIEDKDSEMFKPSDSNFIINYRVNDLEGLVANLRKAGVTILKDPYSHELGKFAEILDPEGNLIALWEQKL